MRGHEREREGKRGRKRDILTYFAQNALIKHDGIRIISIVGILAGRLDILYDLHGPLAHPFLFCFYFNNRGRGKKRITCNLKKRKYLKCYFKVERERERERGLCVSMISMDPGSSLPFFIFFPVPIGEGEKNHV